MLKIRADFRWVILLGIMLIPACGGHPPKPFSSEIIPKEAIGEITEIADRPIWIRFANDTSKNSEAIATLGRKINLGESIRTEGKALVQITLKTGMIIRMQGDALLRIAADNKIELKKGQILVWVPPQRDLTAKIMLSGAIADVKNATVYINSAKSLELIPLAGNVSVLPANTTNSKLIKSGEILVIGQNKANSNQISHKTIYAEGLRTQFKQVKLFSSFNSTIGSQEAIAINFKIPINPTDNILPSTRVVKNSPPPNPEPQYSQPYNQYNEQPYSQTKSESRSETWRSPESNPAPANPNYDPTAPLVTPDFIPMDEPPQPAQPEDPQP